jgi:glycosyltransferase involved in cell wall biosynthesis
MTAERAPAPRPHAALPAGPEIALLLVIDRLPADLPALLRACRDGLAATGRRFEIVCVLDGCHDDAARAGLERLRADGLPLTLLAFVRPFGEAAALSVAARHARAPVLLTLPADGPVAPGDLARLLDALARGADMVIGRRAQAGEGRLARLKTRVLNGLLRVLLKSPFQDLGSGVRALRREVLDELTLYGDQHLFLPLLAAEQGFLVEEIPLAAAPPHGRGGVRLGRLLDVLTIYFLLRFTRRPFRFFGGIGLVILAAGLLATLWLVVERLFLGVGLADRPALILSTLLVVLGFQVMAVGLIGEIITFTHAKDLKEYKVARILD